MILNLSIDEQSYALEVQQTLIDELKPALDGMDKEFDRGLQLGRYWVDAPSDEQRCQKVMNKLINAMHREDKRTLYTMAAYIVYKFPMVQLVSSSDEFEVHEIDIQLQGEV
jgi:hypothetical protein